MLTSEQLARIAFFTGLPEAVLERLAGLAEVQAHRAGELIIHQHDRAIAVYFLLSGSVQFLIHVEGVADLMVAVDRSPGTLIGWSAFRAPFRYTTSVRCEQDCRLLRIPHDAFEDIFTEDPGCAVEILQRVAATMAERLQQTRRRLLQPAIPGVAGTAPASPAEDAGRGHRGVTGTAARLELLAHSPLFEGLEADDLAWLAEQARVRDIGSGRFLFRAGEPASNLYVLVSGRIALFHEGGGKALPLFLRSITGSGEPLGWSALVKPFDYTVSGQTLTPARVLALDSIALRKHCAERPAFGLTVLRRILGVIGSRLRATRIRLVARRYDREVLAIRALLEESAENLAVTSPLYKLPYLLENRLTLADAFATLELLQAHGEPTEQDLATLALELLTNVHRELDFFQGLQRIYEVIAHAPPDLPPEQLRRRSMEEFISLFSRTNYVIRGEDRLPSRPGFIVIMNHLENHPDNELPNDFRLTLDSHFVSSMILYREYGQAPIRLIRKPLPDWYGFQQYFDRLDYIYVYAGDVDEEDRDHHLTREDLRHAFLERAAAHLAAGRNIIIAPEGRCHYTDESPGPFKSGAFRLAAYVQPEPLIVPVAVANFDKQITRSKTAALVMPPFRLSDEVADVSDHARLAAFLERYRETFRGYVREAVHLAGEGSASD